MFNSQLIKSCREELIKTKADLLNRYQSHFADLSARERGGDEADQTVSILDENRLFATQKQLRFMLGEIEHALARIELGTYGVCEETEEPIEPERLQAIPWTRLSIEGAEIREKQRGRRA